MYVAVIIILILTAFAIRLETWQGSVSIHLYMEIVATMLALFAGVIAMVRFYSKKNNMFLFLGTGFLGTAILDGYHTILSSLYFSEQFPSAFPSLTGWSWISARLFLSVMLFLSVLAWKQEDVLGEQGRVRDRTVYLTAGLLLILSVLLFSLVPLPRIFLLELTVPRPIELLPAGFFLLALVGYLIKRRWQQNTFEHWLVISLIVSVGAHALFMPWSRHLFDMAFNVAHVLKIISYTSVLVGLVISMHTLFRQADQSKREALRVNAALHEEINERRRVQEALREQTATVQLLRDIADAANRATTIEDAIQFALDRVCKHTAWSVGHAYILSTDATADVDEVQLVSLGVWHIDDSVSIGPFRRASEQSTFAPGEGLPGRVYVNNEPAWITDVSRENWFVRAKLASACGLKAGFAAPVSIGDRVVAVLEFYANTAIDADDRILDVMDYTGTQLGRVVERKWSEENLRVSEAKFRAVAESANEAIISSDVDGNIMFWNDGAGDIFGYDEEEILGDPITRIVPELFKDTYTQAQDVGRGERRTISNTVEMYGIGKERGQFPVELSLSKWEAGNEQFYTAIIRDITQRKAVERELRKNQMQLTEAQRIANLGSWEWDIETNTIAWSDAMYRVYGLDLDSFDATYEAFLDRVHPDDRDVVRTSIRRAYEDHRPFSFEHRIVRPDGDVRVLQARGKVILNDSGEPVRMIGTGQDVTERKRAQEELERFAARLERSNRELEDFAYIASHDLQEPLRKIMAFGDRLHSGYDDALDDVGRDYLDRMRNAANRMQALIEDLLSLSRVTTRGQPFEETNLTNIVEDVVSDLEIRLEENDGRVEISDLPIVEADPVQMRQLLQNLIINGLKFHRKDEPPVVKVYGDCLSTVEVPQEVGHTDGGVCRIVVEDNGIGFDEKYVDRIFQPFQRLHGRDTYDGTGMGLAICRRIVERHGGYIAAQSADGHGAMFVIYLPVHPKQEDSVRESER